MKLSRLLSGIGLASLLIQCGHTNLRAASDSASQGCGYAGASQSVPAWQRWAENPAALRLVIKGQFKAALDSPAAIHIRGINSTNRGLSCSTDTNFNQVVANLAPFTPYKLTVTGDNVSSVDLDLRAPTIMDLSVSRSARGIPNAPKQFMILIDGAEKYSINDSGGCATYSKSWTIEIRPDNDVQRRNSAGRDDDTEVADDVAPGDADWPEIGPGKSSLPELAGIKWSVPVGRLYGGKSAGRLHIFETGLSSNTYMPPSLVFFQPFTNHTEVTVITNQDTNAFVLRQIKAPQAFVDIVSNQFQMELRFHRPESISAGTNSSGVFTILTNNPFAVWRISNPDQSYTVTRRLRIEEIRNGSTITNEIAYDSTNHVWSLVKGSGAERVTEKRGTYVEGNGIRWETNTVADVAGISYKAVEKYQPLDWGYELTSVCTDPDGAALTQTFTYYTNSADGDALGQLNTVVYPDGFWEKRLYHQVAEDTDPDWIWARPWKGKLAHILRPYKDSPASPDQATTSNCWDTEYLYMPIDLNDYRSSGTGVVLGKINQRYEGNRFSVQEYETHIDIDPTQKNNYSPTHISRQILMLGDTWENWPTVSGEQRYSLPEFTPETAGQLYSSFANHVLQSSFYYEFGTLDSGTFTCCVGNDWRQVAFRGRNYGFGSAQGGTTGDSAPGREFGYGPTNFPSLATSMDGHTIRKILLVPGQSTKDVIIRQKGNVVQRERHIYASANYSQNVWDLLYKETVEVDLLGHVTRIVRVDGASGESRTVYEADWIGTNTFPGRVKFKEINEDGIELVYAYDGMRRLKSVTQKGVSAGGGFAAQGDVVTTFNTDASGRRLASIRSGGGLNLTNRTLFDKGGRVTCEIKEDGTTATNQYASGGRIVTTTFSGGGTKIVEKYLSREVKSVTGTTVVAEYYDYGRTSNQVPEEYTDWETNAIYRTKTVGAQGGARTMRSIFGMVGYHLRDEYPGNGSTLTNYYWYDYVDRVYAMSTPDCSVISNRITMVDFDLMTRTNAQWVYVDGSTYWPKRDSMDRLSTVDVAFVKTNGNWYRVTTSKAFLVNSSATPTASVVREKLNGFNSSTKADITSVDVHSNATYQTVSVDRTAKKLTSVSTTARSSQSATSIAINGLLQSENSFTLSNPARYEYDGLGRQIAVTSPAGVKTTTTIDPGTGKVTSTSDFAGNATRYEYYSVSEVNAGMVRRVIQADGKSTYYAYNDRGQTTRIWGEVPQPEERVYNTYGEMEQLHTYRGGSGWSASTWPAGAGSGDVTTWTYQAATGLLLSKTDAASRAVSYQYYTNNQMMVRSWARGARSTNGYSLQGDLICLNYSDGTSNVVFEAFDRAGQPTVIRDASGDHVYTFDYARQMLSDSCTNGLLSGVVVSNHFASLYGRDYIEVQGVTPALHHEYGYDTYGRLGSVAAGIDTAYYGYHPYADRLQTTTFKHDGNTVFATTRGWEYGLRLQSIANTVNGYPISSFSYQYDAVQRRSRAVLEDGSSWNYGYNDRNELTSAKRFWDDWSPVVGQRFQFAYDNIGNRTSAASGGDASGANLRSTTYTANERNQYSSITTPGYEDILGTAIATNSVAINSGGTDRKGEYYHREIPVSNGSGPLWQSVTVSSGGSSSNGGFVFPKNSQSIGYDFDGNLTLDGIWLYRWDAENRLVEMVMTNAASIPNAQRTRLQFVYDAKGRRVSKTVSTWTGSSFGSTPARVRFVYDGWNLLAILDDAAAVTRSFVWGQDLSGTMDQAGGVGGLLCVTDHQAGEVHFAGYDGNGNVTVLVKTDGIVGARYEYSPFGEPLRVTGPAASVNPFRWSTKFTDEESGLVYYGYRFYSPSIGRWISRDPIKEQGGLNLYVFASNNGITWVDADGLIRWSAFAALVDAVVNVGLQILGQGPEEGMTSVAQSIEEAMVEGGKSHTGSVISGGKGKPPGSQKMFRFEGDFDSAKSRARGGPKAGALMAIGGIVYIASDQPEADAASFAMNVLSYTKNMATGDVAMADLDAAMAALDALNLFGNSAVALDVWDSLTDK